MWDLKEKHGSVNANGFEEKFLKENDQEFFKKSGGVAGQVRGSGVEKGRNGFENRDFVGYGSIGSRYDYNGSFSEQSQIGAEDGKIVYLIVQKILIDFR